MVDSIRIVIADDDELMRSLTIAVVRSLEWEVTVASDGEEAWDCVVGVDPHVVLTDQNMPGLKGLDLVRRIRAQKGDDIKIVVMTDEQTHAEAMLQAGANAYISKPFKVGDLEDTLLRVVGIKSD